MTDRYITRFNSEFLNKDLGGRVYLVTGADSGGGFELTQQLIKQGAHVVMVCRQLRSAHTAANHFVTLKGTYDIQLCDLSDMQSIRQFVDSFLSRYNHLDGLLCNEEVFNVKNKLEYTRDGFESTMAESFFGHFLLTELLLDLLKQTPDSRMLILSSANKSGNPKGGYTVNLDDLHWKKRKFNNYSAYEEAKVASRQYVMELSDRLKDTWVSTYSIHPIFGESSFSSGVSWFRKISMTFLEPVLKIFRTRDTSWDSVLVSLYCILSDEAPKGTDLYQDREYLQEGFSLYLSDFGTQDMDAAKELVALSKSLVGLNH